MASINFSLRKPSGIQTVYFRYRPNRNLSIVLSTPFSISAENWDSLNQCWNTRQIVTGARMSEVKLRNAEIQDFNRNLSNFKSDIEKYLSDNLSVTGSDLKNDLKDYVLRNYFAHKLVKEQQRKRKTIPERMGDLIDFYIEQRSIEDKTRGTKPLAPNTVKKYKTLRGVLHDFDKNLTVTEINDLWRNDFVKYLNKKQYSENTQVKFLKDVKMFCVYANSDLPINKQVLAWEINRKPTNVSEFLTLTFQDIDQLKTAIMPTDKLRNVRDWFLISCYTSVRVSELLNMVSDNIIQSGDDYFIKVHEKKTGNEKIVYLMPQVIEILNKRGGQFPKKYSDQKYNEYLKDVFKQAKFDRLITHGKLQATDSGTRKIVSQKPFYNFISSHSGRATYVTLFSDKLPSEILQIQTNHHSREMLQKYDKTDENAKMLQRAKLVAAAHRELENDRETILLKIV